MIVKCRPKGLWRGASLAQLALFIGAVTFVHHPAVYFGGAAVILEVVYLFAFSVGMSETELAHFAFGRRWRPVRLDRVRKIWVSRQVAKHLVPFFPREVIFTTEGRGFSLEPLWWDHWERLVVAAVDTCIKVNPSVVLSGGAERLVAVARRRVGQEADPRQGADDS